MNRKAGSNSLLEKKDKKFIFKSLLAVKDEGEKLVVWKLAGDSKITSHVKIGVIRKFNNELVFEVEDSSKDKMRAILSGAENINFFVPGKGFLFRAKLRQYDNGTLVTSFPEMVVQTERRKNLRLSLTEEVRASVSFYKARISQKLETQFFNKGCYDISSGGISFLVSKMEQKYFEQSDEISGLKIEFSDYSIEVDGSIIDMIPIEPDRFNGLIYKGFKVCIRFNSLTAAEKELVDLFVFENLKIDEAV